MAEFADFDRSARKDRWEATVRPLRQTDVGDCARIHAARERVGLPRAEARVAGWLSDQHRIVLVAEHSEGGGGQTPAQVRVRGYASASYLAPPEDGAPAEDGAPPRCGSAPEGWYLSGVVVDPPARRHGLGSLLTEARLAAIAERADTVWYFVNARNTPSIALHEAFGFVEHTREFAIPGVSFAGGVGVLFRLDLP